MKLNEPKIIVLLSKLTDNELIEFLDKTPIAFIDEFETIIFKELEIRGVQAVVDRDTKRAQLISSCYHKISQVRFKNWAKNLGSLFTQDVP